MSELWLILFLFLSSVVMIIMSIYALKIRKQIIKGLDEAAVKLADKFVGTNSGGLPSEKQNNHPVAKGLAQGVGAGVGYRLASGGGKNDDDSDKDEASGTERDAQASADSKDTESSDKDTNSRERHLSNSDSAGNGMSTTDSASFDGTGEEARADENNGRQLMSATSLDTGNHQNRSVNTTNVSENATTKQIAKADVSDSTIQRGLSGDIKPAATEKARTKSMDKAVALEQKASMEKNPEKAKQLYADAGYAYDKGGHHKLAKSMYEKAKDSGDKAEAESKTPSRAQKRAVASDTRSKQKHSEKQNDKYGYANEEGVELTYGDKIKKAASDTVHKATSGARSKVAHKSANAADKVAKSAKNAGKKLNDVHRQASQTRREITDETINVVKETRQRVQTTTKNVQKAVETQKTAKAAKAEFKAKKKTLKSKKNDELSDS